MLVRSQLLEATSTVAVCRYSEPSAKRKSRCRESTPVLPIGTAPRPTHAPPMRPKRTRWPANEPSTESGSLPPRGSRILNATAEPSSARSGDQITPNGRIDLSLGISERFRTRTMSESISTADSARAVSTASAVTAGSGTAEVVSERSSGSTDGTPSTATVEVAEAVTQAENAGARIRASHVGACLVLRVPGFTAQTMRDRRWVCKLEGCLRGKRSPSSGQLWAEHRPAKPQNQGHLLARAGIRR